MCIVYHTFTYLKSGFCSAGSRPTLRPTTGKNGAGRKGYKSRFVRKFPRGKLKKGLESSGLRVWTLFVISRSGVRVTPPAPARRRRHIACDVFLCFASKTHRALIMLLLAFGRESSEANRGRVTGNSTRSYFYCMGIPWKSYEAMNWPSSLLTAEMILTGEFCSTMIKHMI